MTKDEQLRYSRHMIMPEVALTDKSVSIKRAVLCIGAGGLVRRRRFISRLPESANSVWSISTMSILAICSVKFCTAPRTSAGKKLDSARDRLRDVNPTIEIETHECRFTSANALEIVSGYDVVVDGSDNFPTRYLSNDVCVFAKKAQRLRIGLSFRRPDNCVRAASWRTVLSLFVSGTAGAWLSPNCAQAGVLGVLPGIIGTIQANEAIKLILGVGEPLVGRLLYFDALKMKFREFNLRRDPQCPVCGDSPTITGPIDYEQFCGVRRRLFRPFQSPS